MDTLNFYIAIISDQKPRAEVLSKIIKKNFKQITEVQVFSSESLLIYKKTDLIQVFLIDLMGIRERSKEIIPPLRKKDDNIKIIAMHMYQSRNLIDPLFRMGIDGYIFYEPTKKELTDAIKNVTLGKKYRPEYLQSA